MKYYTIILPSIICVLFLCIKYIENFQYSILSFGLTIGVFNWKIHKCNLYLNVFLSILFSSISYGIGMLSYIFFWYLIDFFNLELLINDWFGESIVLISATIIAPLLLFNLYKLIFKIPKTKKTNWIIFISIIILIIFSQFFNFEESKNDDLFRLYFMMWQFVMALSLQLIIYQKK